MYPSPGSVITPGGSGTGPDNDPDNPVAKPWSDKEIADGIQQLEDHANDPKNATDKKVTAGQAEAQAGSDTTGGSSSASLPGEKFSYNPKRASGRRINLSRRQKVAFGAAGFIGGGIIFATIPLLAPLKLMQFGNLIRSTHFFSNEDFAEDRNGKFFTQFIRRGSVQGTRLGAISNKVAASWETSLADKSGARMLYDGAGSFAGVEIIDEQKARSSGLLDSLDDSDGLTQETGLTNRLNAGKDGAGDVGTDSRRRYIISSDNVRDDLFQRRGRSMINNLVDSAGNGRVSAFVGTRVLKKLSAVNFHPIEKLQRNAIGSGVDRWYEYKERRAEKHTADTKTGTDPPNLDVRESELDADGNEIDPDPENVRADLDETIDKTQKPDADLDVIKNDLLRNLKRGTGAAAVVAVVCAVKNFGESAAAQKISDTMQIASRIGFEHIAIASQLLTLQDLSWEEIRYFWDLMTDQEGNDVFASVTAQGAMGKTNGNMSYENNPEIDANLIINAYKSPFIFSVLSANPLISAACTIQDGVIGAITGIPGIKQITDAVGGIQNAVLNGALGAFGYSMEELIGMAIGFVNGSGINPLPEGLERGNIAMYGGLYASNTDIHAKGGSVLSPTEVAELEEYQAVKEADEKREKSLFARLLDLTDDKSVVAQAIINSPNSHKEASYAFFKSLNPVANVSKISDSMTASASASTNTFDYGVPKFGFSLAEKNDEAIADPIENAEFVEANFKRLNDKYGECFPSKFDDDINLTIPSLDENPVNQFTISDTCQSYMDGTGLTAEENEEFLRFRVYLYDTVSMISLACVEGDGQACDTVAANNAPINSGSQSGGGNTGQQISDFTGPVIDCNGDPREQVFIREVNNQLNWSTITPTGVIGTDSGGNDIPVYIRDACAGQTEVRTIVIASGIHGLENGGQRVAWELLFNTQLPADVRVIAIPEVSPWATANQSRTNANGVNLNRNFDYEWGTKARDNPNPGDGNYRGPSAASEPETQALQSFLENLGRTSFLASYHSNLNYVASSGPNQKANEAIEQRYFELALPYNIPNRDGNSWRTADESGTGFLEGWYNYKTGTPSFLLELTDSAKTTTEYTKGHAEAIKQMLEEGVIR